MMVPVDAVFAKVPVGEDGSASVASILEAISDVSGDTAGGLVALARHLGT
jgi:hypothetical protein